LLEDLDTGQVLFGQRPSTPRPIASLTKIMTALLVLERSPLTGEVTVSRNAATTPPSDLGLKAGERISVRDLLYGLLLGSANDAAVALAEHVGSSIGGFVTMMNARARQLGMRHTRFRSPNGLDDRGYSTALDLATLTRAVYQHRAFESIVAAKFHTIPGPGTKVRRVQNRNALLWLYPGAIGVKTGFTTPAGHCLVAVAQRDGRRLMAVVLHTPSEPFSAGAALFNYGFVAFERAVLVRAGEGLGPVDVRGRLLPAVAGQSLVALVRRKDLPVLRRRLVLGAELRAPIKAGQVVGTLAVVDGDRVVGEVPVLAARALGPPGFLEMPPEDLTPAGRTAQAVGILGRSLADAFL